MFWYWVGLKPGFELRFGFGFQIILSIVTIIVIRLISNIFNIYIYIYILYIYNIFIYKLLLYNLIIN